MSLRIDILTLFPGMFAPLKESIIKRAGEKGIVDINVINIRDFAFNNIVWLMIWFTAGSRDGDETGTDLRGGAAHKKFRS